MRAGSRGARCRKRELVTREGHPDKVDYEGLEGGGDDYGSQTARCVRMVPFSNCSYEIILVPKVKEWDGLNGKRKGGKNPPYWVAPISLQAASSRPQIEQPKK